MHAWLTGLVVGAVAVIAYRLGRRHGRRHARPRVVVQHVALEVDPHGHARALRRVVDVSKAELN